MKAILLRDRQHGHVAGFSLLETMAAVAVSAIAMASAVGLSIGIVQHTRLDTTTWTLLNRLRLAQTLAATSNTSSAIWLDKFDSRYHLTYGTETVANYQFEDGIHYVDGYLQLNDARIGYNNLGRAQIAGKVRVTNGIEERDIDLYMGVGLQAAGWLLS